MPNVSHHINIIDINYWTTLVDDVFPNLHKDDIKILMQKCQAFLLDKLTIILFEEIRLDNGEKYGIL